MISLAKLIAFYSQLSLCKIVLCSKKGEAWLVVFGCVFFSSNSSSGSELFQHLLRNFGTENSRICLEKMSWVCFGVSLFFFVPLFGPILIGKYGSCVMNLASCSKCILRQNSSMVLKSCTPTGYNHTRDYISHLSHLLVLSFRMLVCNNFEMFWDRRCNVQVIFSYNFLFCSLYLNKYSYTWGMKLKHLPTTWAITGKSCDQSKLEF